MGNVIPLFSLFEIVVGFCTGLGLGAVVLFFTLSQFKTCKTINQEVAVLSKIFRKAKKYIHIQTDLDRIFFDNIKITKALAKATAIGVEIRILADPDGEKIENVPNLKELIDKKVIETKVAGTPFREARIPHFMIVDSKTIRLETFHKPLKFDHDKSFFVIWKNYPLLARSAESGFEKLWERA